MAVGGWEHDVATCGTGRADLDAKDVKHHAKDHGECILQGAKATPGHTELLCVWRCVHNAARRVAWPHSKARPRLCCNHSLLHWWLCSQRRPCFALQELNIYWPRPPRALPYSRALARVLRRGADARPGIRPHGPEAGERRGVSGARGSRFGLVVYRGPLPVGYRTTLILTGP